MTDQLEVQAVRDISEPPVEPKVDASAADYRYPGAPPFADSEMDRLLFRGRAKEIDHVLHSILSFDLFLIYAISGLGKTSLVSAGVMQPLRDRDFFPVIVRLNDPKSSPVELIDEQLRECASKVEGITVMRNPAAPEIEGTPATLWDLLTGLEVWKGNTLQHLVLVFDQFEELFTLGWSDEQRNQFIQQFGQVIRRHRNPSPGPQPDAAVLLPPPAVKVVLIIREDFLGELEAMAQQVPQILRHRFRVDGLAPDQAELAIREPALVSDPRLASRRFSYTEGAAQAMLGFLGARQDRGRAVLTRTIDPSQLQIICQHVERSILPTKSPPEAGASVEITEEDLGGKDGLDRILRDFYRREILSFPANQRKIVRNLCETGLINSRGRRLSLEEEEIATRYKVPKAMLEDLVARRLLRAEPRVGSIYYELAHDTLAAPILAFHDEARKAKRRLLLVLGALVAIVVALIVVLLLVSSDQHSAKKIAIGLPVPATIRNSEQTFQFESPGNQTLIVEIKPRAGSSLDTVQLHVTEPNGRFDDADSTVEGNPQRVVLEKSEAGTYNVVVTEYADTAVNFELSVNPAKVQRMAVGATAAGTIDASKPVAVYEFDPPDDQTFVVELTPRPGDSLASVTLTVNGPDGPLVATPDDANVERVLIDRTKAGPYGVAVSGGTDTVHFELTVRPYDVNKVAIDDTTSGTIDPDNSYGVYEFEPSDGRTLVVGLAPTGGDTADATLQVTGPDGFIQVADSAGDGTPQNLVLPSAVNGRYLVVVSGSATSTFDFDLSVRSADVAEIPIGSPVSGTIDTGNPLGLFEFEPPADQTLVVELKSDENFDAVLEVTDPRGILDSEDFAASGGTETAVITGGVTGQYLVNVSGFDGDTGGFELSVHPATVTEIAVGDTQSATVDRTHPAAVFSFTAPADKSLVVDVKPGSTLHAVLQVTDPDGFISETDNGDDAGPLSWTIDQTVKGRYLVIVSGYASTTGDFEVSVHSG